MTFATIKTRVAQRVIDLPTSVQNDIGNQVNDAILSMQRKYNYRAMEKSVTYVTAADTLTLGTIARFKEYRDRGPYMLRQLSRAVRVLNAVSSEVPHAVHMSTDFPDVPQFVYDAVDADSGVQTFYVAPYPDELSDWDDGNYRIVIPYYQYSAPLVSDGDTNWFTLNAEDYIVYKATAESFADDWDYDSMALWLQRADEKLKEITKADKMQRLAGVDILVPHVSGANAPGVRR